MRLHLVLVAALVLGGCVAKDPPPSPAEELDPGSGNATAPERPDGREGGFAAFNETNATEAGAGGLDHMHDYWQGRERVTLFDGVAALTACCYTTTPMAYANLRTLPLALVYEGAGEVQVTLSDPQRRACSNLYVNGVRQCSDATGEGVADPTGAPGVRLFVRDASKTEFEDAGEVAWGTPIAVPITQATQTDMPHAVSTLWGFSVRSSDPRDDTLRFQVRIEALRAPEASIPSWPGHPEFYAEASERVVLDAAATTKENGPLTVVDPAGSQTPYVPPTKLVSYGTKTLYVFVNVTDVRSENPAMQPSNWALAWRNATGAARAVSGPGHEGAVLQHVWTLPVDDAGMDSPYATASRWGFLVYGDFEVGADTPEGRRGIFGCGACAVYEIAYDIRVVASSVALPEDQYDV